MVQLNSGSLFEIYIFSTTTDFFSSPPISRFPETRSNSLMDRIFNNRDQSSEKMEGVFTKDVLGFLTVYAHR